MTSPAAASASSIVRPSLGGALAAGLMGAGAFKGQVSTLACVQRCFAVCSIRLPNTHCLMCNYVLNDGQLLGMMELQTCRHDMSVSCCFACRWSACVQQRRRRSTGSA
jgi:hypothetical protein